MKSNTNQELYNELLHSGKILATNIKPPYGNNIYKEYTSNRFYDPSNRAFNIYFLKSADFISEIKKNPLFLGYVPPEVFNENDVWDLIYANPLCLINLDDSYIQPKMYATAVMLEPRLLGLLNEFHQTKEIVQEVINKQPLALQYVRDDLKYFYICQKAVSLDWRAIEFVPPNIIDSKIIEIAKESEDAFLLDKIDRSKLDADFYIEQLIKFPIEGATHLIAANLIPNQHRINELIYFIENLDSYSPQYIFDNCDPKVLMHHEKYEAFVHLFSQKPEWIVHLQPCFITKDIFEIAIQNDVYPKLESFNWTGEIIASAYTLNKKAFRYLPYNRLKSVGADRIVQTVAEAIKEGWIDQLPKYFFIDEVVNNEELRQSLLGSRESFAYLITQADKLDWDQLQKFDCSIDEYRLLKQSIPTDKASIFFEKNVESYIAFTDDAKTIDRTEIFLKKYPSQVRSIPRETQQNHVLMSKLIENNPIISRYLDPQEIVEIFSNAN